MPATISTIIASTTGTQTLPLDWMASGPITVRLTAVATDAGAGCRVQITLSDLTLPATSQIWSGLSSQGEASYLSTATLSSGSLFVSSTIMDSQLIFKFLTPLSGIRLVCSGAASSGGMRMDVIQGKSF